jgi:hypothetical protein
MFQTLPVTGLSNKKPDITSIVIKRFLLKFFLVLFLAIVSFTCLPACKQGQETPPIPEKKMGKILVDIHLAETYSQGLGDSATNKFEKNTDSLAGFYTSILKHYNLSFKEFNEALEWYKERPVTLDSLYGKVLIQLIELKAQKGIKDIDEATPKNDSAALAPRPLDTLKPRTDSIKFKNIAADTGKSNRKDSLFRKRIQAKPIIKPTK